ncbi:lipoprotein [Spiroplasma citri]|uniref:lipoprotein n=1 Tax=Spiroplasma citri TaxID=2133 RepID=UPI002412C722|nr:lipoprotein [Spiroplasma citri]WFH00158.1 lipoprotein [Spiroplasma citri]
MKKWLSIIGTIGLTATSTTTLMSCKKENNKDTKPIAPTTKAQQPPEGSNWKLIDKNNINNQFSIYDEKWYIIIAKNTTNQSIEIIKFKNNQNEKSISPIINNTFYIYPIYNNWYSIINLYCWDGDGEPETPTIDKNTGEIIDWKEQKGTK